MRRTARAGNINTGNIVFENTSGHVDGICHFCREPLQPDPLEPGYKVCVGDFIVTSCSRTGCGVARVRARIVNLM